MHDFVHAVNLEFKSEISFPHGNRLQNVISSFQDFCGPPVVVGAIDGTHIYIRKLYVGLRLYYPDVSRGRLMETVLRRDGGNAW